MVTLSVVGTWSCHFAHLAILHGKVDTLATAVSKTTHRVDILTNLMTKNANLIQKMMTADLEFSRLVTALAVENVETP